MEVVVDGSLRRHGPVGMLLDQESADLLGSDGHPAAGSDPTGLFEDVGWGRVGAAVGPVRAVLEAFRTEGLVPVDPLVGGLAANAVSVAELGDGEATALPLHDELLPFGHGIGLLPGHGASLSWAVLGS